MPALNTSTCWYWLTVIEPPTGNRKSAFCDQHHTIYMKFKWFALLVQYSDISTSTATRPDARMGARARSSLLAALIRARALKVRSPIVSVLIFPFLLSGKWIAFLTAFPDKKFFLALQTVQAWWKFKYFIVLMSGRGQMAQQRPLNNSPDMRFHVHVRNLVGTCIMPRRTKKPHGPISKNQQEVGHF